VEPLCNRTIMKITRLLSIDGMSAVVVLMTLFVIPFLAVPSHYVQNFPSQTIFISIGVVIAFLCLIALLIKNGGVVQVMHPFFLWVVFMPSIFLTSALFSDVPWRGLTGYSYEVGTFGFVAILFLLMLIVSVVFRTKEVMMYTYTVFFISFFLIVALYVVDVVLRTGGIAGVSLVKMVVDMVGGWYDVGFYFGALALLGMMTIEMVRLTRSHLYALAALIVVSLAGVVVVNISTVWLLLGGLSLLFSLYVLLHSNRLEVERVRQKKVPFVAIILTLLCVIFYFSGNYISQYVPVTYSSDRLTTSWEVTGIMFERVFADVSLLGSGPNGFSAEWASYIQEKENTVGLVAEAEYSAGLIPTLAISTGIIGTIAWALFFITYLVIGAVSIRKIVDGVVSRYFAVSSFVVSLFFWITAVVYTPSVLLFSLSFFFSGFFLSSLYLNGIFKGKTLMLFMSPTRSVVQAIVIVFLFISSSTFGFSVIKKATASHYFKQAMSLSIENAEVERLVNMAIRIDENDIYYCVLSKVHLAKIDTLRLYVPDEGMLPGEYESIRTMAIDDARQAVASDPTNYRNWICLGDAYASLPKGGGVARAEDAYRQALTSHPHKHLVYTSLAQLYWMSGNIDDASREVQNALSVESDYTEALLLQSKIIRERDKGGDNTIVW